MAHAVNMALPQYWLTVIFSTFYHYQSFVIGLTEYYIASAFCYALRALAVFSSI